MLAPYSMEKCNDNDSILIKTIDDEAFPMLVNGHRLKVYKKPLSKRDFIEYLNKKLMVVEHVLASTSPTHWRKKRKIWTQVKTSMRRLSPIIELKTSYEATQ